MSFLDTNAINQMTADLQAGLNDPPGDSAPTTPQSAPVEPTALTEPTEPTEQRTQPEPPSGHPEPAEPTATPGGQSATPPSSPPPPPRTLTDEQWAVWEFYSNLDSRVRSDAELAQRLQAAFNPPPPAAPLSEAQGPQEGGYIDPQIQSLTTQLTQLRSDYERINSILNQSAATRNEEVLAQVKQQFKQSHSLDDTQLAQVYEAAQRYAPALSNFSSLPLHEALTNILEAGYWSLPSFRDAEIQRQLASQQEAESKRNKAGSLTSSSGSAPRTIPDPKSMSEQAKRDAMIREVAEAIGQPTNNE